MKAAGRILIVEDGSGSNVLAAVRSLGRAGWTVGLGVPALQARAASSRFVARLHRVPCAEEGLDAFVGAVNSAIRSGGYDVVFPGDDIELLALSERRDEVDAVVPLAPPAAVLRSVDKLSLTTAARRAGVAVPVTVAATADAVEECDLPVVVKSRLHWTPGTTSTARHLLVRVCHDRSSVRDRVAEIETAGGAAILQQPITGILMAVSTVMDVSGRAMALCQQRTTMASLRRTSVRAVTTPLDPALVEPVLMLLRELGWLGLANLQFLAAPGDEPRLIDFNGRYYGSMALAIAAGADFPERWAALAMGGTARTTQVARPGVRFHSFEEDLARALEQRQGGLLADLWDTARSALGSADATWSLHDPTPGLLMARRYLAGASRRVSSRLGPLIRPGAT